MKLPQPRNVARGTGRAVTGGGILLAALALLMFLRHGPGTSNEDPGKDSDGTDSATESVTDPATIMVQSDSVAEHGFSTSPRPSPDESASPLTDEERQALAGSVITVEIDDYSYLLEYGPENDLQKIARPVDRIVHLAGQARGDSNGLKIRIREIGTTRPRAELELREALKQAGISENAIHTTRFSEAE
ncbi:MAG: hypothetical protein KDA96_05895 [Planctomycetaceae bacterium]|nr:hypothetical protein [Planctomycetaceae bacterium]